MWVLRYLPRYEPVGVDHRRGVVVDALGVLILLVHRHDEDHAGLLRQLLHALRGRAVRDVLGVAEVLRVLDLAEVRAVEQLLEAHHLRAIGRGLARVVHVLLDHRLLVAGPLRLEQRGADDSRHEFNLRRTDSARTDV